LSTSASHTTAMSEENESYANGSLDGSRSERI
jgi:hypothetical protein